jgi:hypothetical protein
MLKYYTYLDTNIPDILLRGWFHPSLNKYKLSRIFAVHCAGLSIVIVTVLWLMATVLTPNTVYTISHYVVYTLKCKSHGIGT